MAAFPASALSRGGAPPTPPPTKSTWKTCSKCFWAVRGPMTRAGGTALGTGASPASVVAGIGNSQGGLFDRGPGLYQHYLHRAADSTGLNSFVGFLEHGGTFEQVRAAIVGSGEYLTLHGGTVAGFLAALYEDALGRQADPAGVNGFTQMLAAGTSRAQVATLFYSSTEYRLSLVRGDYDFALERSADPDGLLGWFGFLRSGGDDQTLLANLLGSPEGFAKHSS